MRIVIAVVLAMAAVLTSQAQEVVLFSAATAGVDAWAWGGAVVKAEESFLAIREKSPTSSFGDAFVDARLPYFPDGEVELDVASISGGCSLQVLAFQGTSLLASIDALKDVTATGAKKAFFNKLVFPAETDGVVLKIWVGGHEGATVRLKDLKYTIPGAADRVILDKVFGPGSTVEADGVVWDVGAAGAMMSLAAGRDYGSALLPDSMPRAENAKLLLDLPAVKNGTVTAQMVFFGQDGTYLDSTNALVGLSSGFAAGTMAAGLWPEQATSFQIKLWLGGKPDASAQIRRVLILK